VYNFRQVRFNEILFGNFLDKFLYFNRIFYIMESQSYDIDSTTMGWEKAPLKDHSTRFDPNETPTVNSTNPNYHPTSTLNNSAVETAANKANGELKKGQQHAEDIITKSKRLVKHQCKFNQDKLKHNNRHFLNVYIRNN
jgi:hypothetical protein